MIKQNHHGNELCFFFLFDTISIAWYFITRGKHTHTNLFQLTSIIIVASMQMASEEEITNESHSLSHTLLAYTIAIKRMKVIDFNEKTYKNWMNRTQSLLFVNCEIKTFEEWEKERKK